jgi:RNA polymerase sigma-70 factor (ECF subfamily)
VIDESELIERACAGDQVAFGQLVEKYQNRVYNLAYRMLSNPDEAEEAAQEAFLRAYTNLHRYDPNRSFKTWLLSITSHYCIDRIRRRHIAWLPLKEEIAVPMRFATPSPNPEAVTIRHEREAHIQRMLDGLSATDRAAITLRYWYDCSYEEIADVLDLTVSAVKSRLYRARRALAEMVEQGEMSYAL